MLNQRFDWIAFLLVIGLVGWLLFKHTRFLHWITALFGTEKQKGFWRKVAVRSLAFVPMIVLIWPSLGYLMPMKWSVANYYIVNYLPQFPIAAMVLYLALRPWSSRKWKTLLAAMLYLMAGMLFGFLIYLLLKINLRGQSQYQSTIYFEWFGHFSFFFLGWFLLVIFSRFGKFQLVKTEEEHSPSKPVSLKFLMVMQVVALLLLMGFYRYFAENSFPSDWLKISHPAYAIFAIFLLTLSTLIHLGIGIVILRPIHWQLAGLLMLLLALLPIKVWLQQIIMEQYVFDIEQMGGQFSVAWDHWDMLTRIGWSFFWVTPMVLVALMMKLDGLRIERRRS